MHVSMFAIGKVSGVPLSMTMSRTIGVIVVSLSPSLPLFPQEIFHTTV